MQAVCFNCGGIKGGAFAPCAGCGRRPTGDDDLALSVLITDQYYDAASLRRMAEAIRDGDHPQLDAGTRHTVLRHIARFRGDLIGRLATGTAFPAAPKKRWWWPF